MVKITPITPRKINTAMMQQAFVQGMRDVGERIREEFEDTTRTWNHQPKFDPPVVIPVVGIDAITVETTTVDKIYGWVNEGTNVGKAPYPIHPKSPKKALAFPSEFIPKTFPGIVGSGAGFSNDLIVRNSVMHPGVEPRKFDKEIASRQKNHFKNSMEKAMVLAAMGSGHKFR